MALVSNLSIDQGSDFQSVIYVETAEGTVANISGYTARGQVRKTYGSTTAVDFHTVINNATGGRVSISLTKDQTAAMKAGRYVYDVEIVSSDGEVSRIVEGQIEITPRVTRI